MGFRKVGQKYPSITVANYMAVQRILHIHQYFIKNLQNLSIFIVLCIMSDENKLTIGKWL